MDSLEAKVGELRKIEAAQDLKKHLQWLKQVFNYYYKTSKEPLNEHTARVLLAGEVFLFLKKRGELEHLEKFWALFEEET